MNAPVTKPSRQELTWSACDALASLGKKPSIGLVREWTVENGNKQGSDGAVQGDINAWYENLLNMRKRGYLDLPPTIASLFAKLWAEACDAADLKLEKERENLAVELAEKEKLIDLAQQDTEEAVKIANSLTMKLTIAHNEISTREDLIRRQDEALSEMRSTMQSKDQRIEGLIADMNRITKLHASSVEELNGLRKHSLLQIDEARLLAKDWQTRYERVDQENQVNVLTYRQRSSKLEAELATMTGRNTAIEEALAAATLREQKLNAEIARLNAADGAESVRDLPRRRLVSTGKIAKIKRKKL